MSKKYKPLTAYDATCTRIAEGEDRLPVALTAHELQEALTEAAALGARIIDLEIEKKEANEVFNAELKDLKATHQETVRMAHTKTAKRSVTTVVYADLATNSRVVVRVDTGEEVSRKALGLDERERALQLDLYKGEEPERQH